MTTSLKLRTARPKYDGTCSVIIRAYWNNHKVDLERVRSGAYRLLLGQFSDGSRSRIQVGK